jgi:acyl-coenzyme A synthetase/AMP-(fatty) acid ligase
MRPLGGPARSAWGAPLSNAPLISGDDLDAPLAWRDGQALTRRQYLADVRALAAALPASGPMFNVTADRYRFAVGLGAALLRGQDNLLPPNHTPDTVARLLTLFPGTYGLTDEATSRLQLPMVHYPADAADVSQTEVVPRIARDALAARVLTSGSTGAPVPHAKHWGLLVSNAQAGARRLARQLGRATLDGVTLVATVPAQHMYGFESSVLVALLGGAAFDAGRPFYPVDIAAALARAARPRLLVTAPFHLKMLLDAGIALPQIDLTVCATAPLPPQLATRAEAALGAPLMEIYGCTEAGQVASRRTVEGPEWHVYDGLVLSGDGEHAQVSGGHVPELTPLADVLDVIDAQTFRLLGRSNDLINIAGKRSSLSHLNHHLNSVEGVQDGAFWLPAQDDAHGVARLVAFVVAPGLTADALHAQVLRGLRERLDAAFLPRRIVGVPALPREPTGKLPAEAFKAWAERTLARGAANPASGAA